MKYSYKLVFYQNNIFDLRCLLRKFWVCERTLNVQYDARLLKKFTTFYA